MNYPLISEYIEAIKSADDNLNELANLHPVLDENGEPVFSSGNFAVVFKMEDEQTGKLFAVKCFLKEQNERAESYKLIVDELKKVNSPYVVHVEYYDKELFVDTSQSVETEFPVLIMNWVEGQTLDKYLYQNKYDGYKLSCLVSAFYDLSIWLLSQPFAHGDLKPDNIIVTNDGCLVLIDYDGMFVPKMIGQKPREKGTPNYRNSFNNKLSDSFSKKIDDFAIVHILLGLRVYSLFPCLITKEKDSALFSSNDFSDISNTPIYQKIISSRIDAQTSLLLVLFQKLVNGNSLHKEDLDALDLKKRCDEFVNFEDRMCSLDNIVKAANLAYSSMLYKDPARSEICINDYKDIEDRISLAIEMQGFLKNHEWPYQFGELGIKYSYLKPNGIEKREGMVLDLVDYTLRYLYGLIKYNISKRLANNIYGGGDDVFELNCNERKYESYFNAFVKDQEFCAKQYEFLYVFDIRNFFNNVDFSKVKDFYFDNNFSNVYWYDDLFSEMLAQCTIQGLNPCAEVDCYFANLYLKSLDEKMMEYDGIKYFRYNDDIRVYSNDGSLLNELSDVIKSVLSPLSLTINTNKTRIINTKEEPVELAKACFIWSCNLYIESDGSRCLLDGQNLAQIIENDLTTAYLFQLLEKINDSINDSAIGYSDGVMLHLDNLFYILKNVHKNATLYRVVSQLIFDVGINCCDYTHLFSYILDRIIEILKDDAVEPFVKYWIIRTYYCSDKQYYKQYLKWENEWSTQSWWPRPGYNKQIVDLIDSQFRKKGTDPLLSHISDYVTDYVISIVEPSSYDPDIEFPF